MICTYKVMLRYPVTTSYYTTICHFWMKLESLLVRPHIILGYYYLLQRITLLKYDILQLGKQTPIFLWIWSLERNIPSSTMICKYKMWYVQSFTFSQVYYIMLCTFRVRKMGATIQWNLSFLVTNYYHL